MHTSELENFKKKVHKNFVFAENARIFAPLKTKG
jgi:hypothetical protein